MNKFFLFALLVITSRFCFAQDTLVLISGRKIATSSVLLQENSIKYRSGKKLKSMDPMRVFSVIYKDGTEHIVYQPDSLDPMDFKVDEMRNFIKGQQDAISIYKNNYIKVTGVVVGVGSGLLGFYGLIGPPLYATVVGAFSPNVDKKLSFEVSGDAADAFGITPGKYLNEVSGKSSRPIIKKDQKLKLGGKCIKFKEDTDVDNAAALIDSKFSCIRIHASNDNGNLRLFKTNSTQLISDSSYKEGFSKRVRDYKIRNGMLYGLIGFVAGSITFGIIY